MSSPTPQPVALPRWLIIVGSIAILLHLTAIVGNVLATTSGPWPTPEGGNMSPPPQFAFSLTEIKVNDVKVIPAYLQGLKFTHTYHFATSRPSQPGAFFEVRLRDAEGKEIRTEKFPNPQANYWVRHRQSLLAQGLADDMPVVRPTTELVAAPNQEAPNAMIWEGGATPGLRLRTVPQHLIPNDRPVFRPTDWALLLAKAYGRHLLRATPEAASAEVIRHTRDPYPPVVLFIDTAPPGAFEELISYFGEVTR